MRNKHTTVIEEYPDRPLTRIQAEVYELATSSPIRFKGMARLLGRGRQNMHVTFHSACVRLGVLAEPGEDQRIKAILDRLDKRVAASE